MSCRGRGSNYGDVRETINIPKGVDNGVNLRVSKKGHSGSGGPAGDLIVHVKVKPHAYFKREGANIHTDLFVSLGQVVLGAEIPVRTLYGNVRLKVAAGSQHDER
jgi:molecular chaperone DnaJ